MKQKRIRLYSRAAMMLLMLLLTTTTAWAWSGSGNSQNDPILIANASDLIQLATNVNNGTDYSGKYFKQTAPITLTSAWTPIGTSSKPFKGKYDGDNKTISGLTVSGSYQYAGLFGYTCGSSSSLSSCTLKNIIVTDCNIDVSGTNESYAGGIVGYASDDTQIRNCRVSGTVKAKTNAGGIVGILWTTPGGHIAQMIECFADVTVQQPIRENSLVEVLLLLELMLIASLMKKSAITTPTVLVSRPSAKAMTSHTLSLSIPSAAYPAA